MNDDQADCGTPVELCTVEQLVAELQDRCPYMFAVYAVPASSKGDEVETLHAWSGNRFAAYGAAKIAIRQFGQRLLSPRE